MSRDDRHFLLSAIKSTLRGMASLALLFSGHPFMVTAGAFLLIAEIFGVLEEL